MDSGGVIITAQASIQGDRIGMIADFRSFSPQEQKLIQRLCIEATSKITRQLAERIYDDSQLFTFVSAYSLLFKKPFTLETFLSAVRPTVFILDNDNASSLEEMLAEKYRTEIFYNGEDILTYLRSHLPREYPEAMIIGIPPRGMSTPKLVSKLFDLNATKKTSAEERTATYTVFFTSYSPSQKLMNSRYRNNIRKLDNFEETAVLEAMQHVKVSA